MSPQIKSSKSTLSKAAGRRGGRQEKKGTLVVPSNSGTPGGLRAVGEATGWPDPALGLSPISSAGSLKAGVGFFRPACDRHNTDPGSARRLGKRIPIASPGGRGVQSHSGLSVGGQGTVPLGKLILMAIMEPSWQGESGEGRVAPQSTATEAELGVREDRVEGGLAHFFGWSERAQSCGCPLLLPAFLLRPVNMSTCV